MSCPSFSHLHCFLVHMLSPSGELSTVKSSEADTLISLTDIWSVSLLSVLGGHRCVICHCIAVSLISRNDTLSCKNLYFVVFDTY